MKKIIIILLFISAQVLNAKINIHKDSTFDYNFSARGFTLTVEPNEDPYYHASTLIDAKHDLLYKNKLSLKLRTVAEIQNFSMEYDHESNNQFWVGAALGYKIENVFGYFDSLNVLAGDLGRVKHGLGLSMDYYESLGVELVMSKGEYDILVRTIGVSWKGTGDAYMASFRNDLIGVNAFYDFGGGLFNVGEGSDNMIFSADINYPLIDDLNIYSEFGYNIGQSGFGVLAGIDYKLKHSNGFICAKLEGRIYDAYFDNNFVYMEPYYFLSMTAIDKPLMNSENFINRNFKEAASLHLNIKQRIFDKLYFKSNVEFFYSSDIEVPLDITLAYEVLENSYLEIGIINKFMNEKLQYYFGNNELIEEFSPSMFRVHDEPSLLLRASFEI